LNLSVLDGWWDEGYAPQYGWAIGNGEVDQDQKLQDLTESQALYNLLEHQVAPSFYNRTVDGIPLVWCEMMRNSIKDLVPRFSSHRMVNDYFERFYRQSSQRYNSLTANSFKGATDQAAWCNKLMTSWGELSVLDVQSPDLSTVTVGQDIPVTARVRLGSLVPEDITVELYFGKMSHQGEFEDREILPLTPVKELEPSVWSYQGQIPCSRPGRFGYTARITPSREKLGNPLVLGLITWA
jgi:starch phosphorylase